MASLMSFKSHIKDQQSILLQIEDLGNASGRYRLPVEKQVRCSFCWYGT